MWISVWLHLTLPLKKQLQCCPVSKTLPGKNSFSQWSPVELSENVLELNNSCAHVSRSMLSNLQPLSKARPSLASVGPYDLWLILYILMAYSICPTIITLEKKKSVHYKQQILTMLQPFSIDSPTYLRLKSVGSFESAWRIFWVLKKCKDVALSLPKKGVYTTSSHWLVVGHESLVKRP